MDDPLRLLISILALLAGFVGLDEAFAQSAYTPTGFEVRAGVLAHDVPDLWSGFRLGGVDINAELLGPGVAFWAARCAPPSAAPSTPAATSKAYRRPLVRPALRRVLRPGPRRSTTATSIRPSRTAEARLTRPVPHSLRARLPLGHHQSLSVYFEHTSNDPARHNEALDNMRHPLRLPLRRLPPLPPLSPNVIPRGGPSTEARTVHSTSWCGRRSFDGT